LGYDIIKIRYELSASKTQDGTPSRLWILSTRKQESNTIRNTSVGCFTSGAIHRRYHKKGLLELLHPGKTKMVLKKGKKYAHKP